LDLVTLAFFRKNWDTVVGDGFEGSSVINWGDDDRAPFSNARRLDVVEGVGRVESTVLFVCSSNVRRLEEGETVAGRPG